MTRDDSPLDEAELLAADVLDFVAVDAMVAALVRRGRAGDAESLLKRALEKAPSWGPGQYRLGCLLVEAGRFPEAIPYLRSATELMPDSAEALYHFGTTAVFKVGTLVLIPQGQEALRKAARLEPGWPEAQFALGRAVLRSSIEAEAEIALKKALELRPDWTSAAYELAYAMMEQDRIEEAIPHLEFAATDPSLPAAKRVLARLTQRKKSKRTPLARYPRSQREFSDVQKVINDYILTEFQDVEPLISMSSKVFTMGSCFAGNIARKLAQCGIDAEWVNFAEELNSTYANRYFLEWAKGETHSKQGARIQEVFGDEYAHQVRAKIRGAKLIIYSLGVAPCFFDRETGDFTLTLGENLHASLAVNQLKFRTTSVQENVDNLKRMIELLRELNPQADVMLTVSPVPLKATFERSSAIVADCISKSTLRVAAHEIMELGLERVHYWPSYEMVKWIGCHTGPVFGMDDESPLHANDEVVKRIIDSFLEVYGDNDVIVANRRAQDLWRGVEESKKLSSV
jgi:tetratricopeptide (TPR) repeat protein